jgi:predicted glycoside hydrolase/deacetylase ChbG (UPF0249 family)/SAM-dependent methyltransferase
LAETTASGRSARPPAAGRCVVFHADDFGLLYAFNEGIRIAHQRGLLGRASLRANGYAYDHAVHDVLPTCPQLVMGVHLCLNEAEPIAPRHKVMLLLDRHGSLRDGFFWLMRLARTQPGRDQIEREFRAQIEKILADGIAVDQLDSHWHVHMIPEIFRITCGLAAEYDIRCVRMSREPRHAVQGLRRRIEPFLNTNYAKYRLLTRFARRDMDIAGEFGIVTTDHLLGVTYSGFMDVETIAAGLEAAKGGCVEVLMHPATGPDPRDEPHATPLYRAYLADAARAREVETLVSHRLRNVLRRNDWAALTSAPPAASAQAIDTDRIEARVDVSTCRLFDSITIASPPWVSTAMADSRAFGQLVLSQMEGGRTVLDVGTGSGILAIGLAKAGAEVVATDVSGLAVRAARANAARNSVQFECYRSDLLESVIGRFDIIAFNPPYNFAPDTFLTNVAKNLVRRIPFVRRNCGQRMPAAVAQFRRQLVRRFLEQAPARLNTGGRILLLAFESEASEFRDVAPPGADVRLIDYAPLRASGTVTLSIRFAAQDGIIEPPACERIPSRCPAALPEPALA